MISKNRLTVSTSFNNVLLAESINLAVDLILKSHTNLKLSKDQLIKLFEFTTSGTPFLFKDQYYDQVDGLAIGALLGPLLANLSMAAYEEKCLSNY